MRVLRNNNTLHSPMRITVVGSGYVGLVTGTCLARGGHRVTGVDIDREKVDRLERGDLPIFEPGLEDLFTEARADGRLDFTTRLADSIPASDAVFLTLPTPSKEDGSADVSALFEVVGPLVELAEGRTTLAIKSTVPVGTGDRIQELVDRRDGRSNEEIGVVSNPEFLREGSAVEDFRDPDRIIVGTDSTRSAEVMRRVYAPAVDTECPFLVMGRRSAEMAKYASNAMLATRISFMNEIANVCERTGADVSDIRKGMGLDPRIGEDFLRAGIGFGGSCFPKDTRALCHTAAEHDYEPHVLSAVIEVNEHQRALLARRVVEAYGEELSGVRVAVWGLAFKPGTDDTREAPSHVVLERLLAHRADVSVFDPEAKEATRARFGECLDYGDDPYETVRDADVLLICTEWPQFVDADYESVRELMDGDRIFDGRNICDPRRMRELGFDYRGVGRPSPANRATNASEIRELVLPDAS